MVSEALTNASPCGPIAGVPSTAQGMPVDTIQLPPGITLPTALGHPAPGLQPGQVVQALVLELIQGDVFRLQLPQAVVDVRSSAPLMPGSTVTVEVKGGGPNAKLTIYPAAPPAPNTPPGRAPRRNRSLARRRSARRWCCRARRFRRTRRLARRPARHCRTHRRLSRRDSRKRLRHDCSLRSKRWPRPCASPRQSRAGRRRCLRMSSRLHSRALCLRRCARPPPTSWRYAFRSARKSPLPT